MYPVFMDLKGKPCLIVGGGRVAERKAEKLLETGAKVLIVAREASDGIKKLAEADVIDLDVREYEKGEAAGYFLVIAATSDNGLNRRISEDARMAGRLVNVVDVPELCNFYVPSVVRRGEMQIAISTSGAAPALAKKIRKKLESDFNPNYEKLLNRLREFRALLIECIQDEEERKEILTRVVNSSELDVFLNGDESPLEALLRKCI